jgi:hypothetical protein
VNPGNWDFLTDTAGHMMRKRGMPRAEPWFSRAVLETSVFDTGTRYRVLTPLLGDGEEVFASLVGIAPRHPLVVDWVISRLPSAERTVESVTKELGPRAEFDVVALRQLRDAAKDEAERVSILSRMCDLDANYCVSLGGAFVRLDRPEDAAAAFQKAVDEASDRVSVCNDVYWLVNYYFDRGRVTEARDVAAMAAEVYCSRGLLAQAYLSERMGRPVEAEKWYRANAERYHADRPVSNPLLGFYYRMARVQRSEEFEPALEEMLPRVFPQGLEPLPAAFDGAPPTDGVLIDGNDASLREAGLRGADVIVGLDGYRVHSLEQYDAVRNFQTDASGAKAMRLRVFRQTQYLDVQAEVSGRHFGVHVRTYGTPGPSVEYR